MSNIAFILINLVCFMPLIVICSIFIISRRKYKNITVTGAFFFENDCLVLNTGIPYPIPFDMIDYVELKYSSRELESRLSYGLSIRVYQKDGKKKYCFYKGYRTAKLALPSDMVNALEENGIRCVVIDK